MVGRLNDLRWSRHRRRTLAAVSTRKLILTALLCGLAILVAGGIQLIRLSDDEVVQLRGLGVARTIDGVAVTAGRARGLRRGHVRHDRVHVAGAAGSMGSWTLLRGTTFDPEPATGGELVDCVDIDLAAEATGSCIVAFSAPGDARRATWRSGPRIGRGTLGARRLSWVSHRRRFAR